MEKLKNFFYHLFIPNEKNNYKAKALHTDFLFIYLIIAVFLTFSFKKINVNNVLGFATDITVEKLFELTNKERQKNNLKPLNYNENLSKAAYEKALDMFSKNYWAHFGPNGETPWEFILKNNYQYEYAGENLAKNFLFSNGVVSAWMNSPSHRENILRKEYTDVGFAVVNGILNGEETTLVVQMFANPLNKTLTRTNNYSNENTKTFVEKHNNSGNQKNIVLAQTTTNKNALNWQIVFNSQILFFIFLIIALVLDIYFAEKFGIIRIEGKNLAHFIFIFFILLSLLIISKGAII
ncbi:MAG: CAP domain-containing protein [Patescibacteria group bacterium]|nr:CAP domain-containing protein [Patescibacteria group bacterium]